MKSLIDGGQNLGVTLVVTERDSQDRDKRRQRAPRRAVKEHMLIFVSRSDFPT